MTYRVENPPAGAVSGSRDTWTAIRRGASGRCPACGNGKLFKSFLKVSDACPSCGTELHHHRADDAPPYFTMLIVGHVIGGGILSVEQAFSPSHLTHLLIWIPLTIILSLGLLTPIKGGLIGLQWAQRMHGFGTDPDPAAPDVDGLPAALAGKPTVATIRTSR